MRFIIIVILFICVPMQNLLAEQPLRPPLQLTAASPLGFGSDGALNALPGWDFNGDGKEELVTLGFTAGGMTEVRINLGDGAGNFGTGLGGGVTSLGSVSLNATEDTLGIGMLFPAEALGASPQPGVAVIAGGALRLFNTTPGGAQSITLVSKTAPTFAGATLRSLVVSDLDGDNRADLVLSGRIDAGNNPGAVWVVLNSAAGLQAPVQLAPPGSEAGELAVGDVNGDGQKDIVVVDTAENCAKVYLATAAGVFGNAPVTVEAYGPTPSDVRPRAVAVGQILPGGAEEIVLWNDAEVDANNRTLQLAIFEHTGGATFARHALADFGTHGNNFIHYGDLTLGDMNNDGQLDIVGTNPAESGVVIWPIGLNGSGDVETTFTPLVYRYSTSNTPDTVAVGNFNGDATDNASPKLDVLVTHYGQSPNRTVDVFLNAPSATLPPGTPRITSSTWPILGGDLTATGAPSGTLRFTALVNGNATSELPTGQKLSSLGEIVGVARNGTYTVTVQVKSGTKSSMRTFTFTVNNTAPLARGAAAWWPGEDAGADVVEGHALAGLTDPAYAAGKVGRAFSFDGVDDFLFAGDADGTLDVRGNITIEAWVRPAPDSKGIRTILAKHDSADADLTFALQLDSAGRLSFVAQRATDKKPTVVTSFEQVPNGEWTHVGVRVRGIEVTIFINGGVDSTRTIPATFFPPSTVGQAVTVGATCTSPTGDRANFWKGEIDELTIYRRPLDDVEVDLVAKVGEAGKVRFDAAREFSTTSAPQPTGARWSYGLMANGTITPASFTPFPVLDTTGPAVDVWKTNAAGAAEVRRNRLTTTHATGTGTTGLLYAPGQVAQQRGSDGSYSVVRWTAPAAGRYTVAATWKCIDFGGIAAGLTAQHNSLTFFHPNSGPSGFLGHGTSFAHTITVAAAGEPVDFIVGQNFADTRDTVGLFASVVALPAEYVPVVASEPIDVDFDLPSQTGKEWVFRAKQNDSQDHTGRMELKLQYSATPGDPNSWTDVPGGALARSSSLTWKLATRNLPVGNFAFRVATSVTGYDPVFGPATQMFNIVAATTLLEFVSHEASVASDPSGLTTHRGDLITYRFKVRNAGGLPADNAALRVIIPKGTKAVKKTKGSKLKLQRPLTPGGQTLSYLTWSLGDLASVPEDDAAVYEMVVQVLDPAGKDELLNAPGTVIEQNNFALYTGTFENPTSYVFGPLPTFAHTVVNPLSVSAAVLEDSLFARGGLVQMEFTLRNAGSTVVKKAGVNVVANNGLVIQRSFNALTFLIGGAESGAPPMDPATKKLATILGLKGNPVLREQTDRRQIASFGVGQLAAGAEQKVRVVFRVPYDWPLDLPITLDAAYAYVYSTTGRVVARDFPAVTLTADPNADPAPPKPVLLITANQVTAGILEGTSDIGSVTTAPLGVPGITPKRTSNYITYRVLMGNVGTEKARFCKAIFALPEHTTFKAKSARLVTTGNIAGQELADPVLKDGQLFFDVPNLDPDGSPSPATVSVLLDFTVKVDNTTPVGTRIVFPGAIATSREVLQPGFNFQERVAQVVPSGRIDFTYSASPQTFNAATPLVYHAILFHNAGGLPRSGVTVKYSIPAGLKFENAVVNDRPQKYEAGGTFGSRPIIKPNVGATSGDVVFNIGTVKPGAFGFAHIILKPNAAAVPTSNTPTAPDIAYRATASWIGYDDLNNPLSPLRFLRRTFTSAPTGDAPTQGIISHRFSAANSTKPFMLLTGPASAKPGDSLTYQIGYGNMANVDEFIGDMIFPIPAGTEYVSATNTVDFGQAINGAYSYQPPGITNPYPDGYVSWDGRLNAHTFRLATVTVRVKAGATGKIVAGEGARYDCQTSGKVHSQTVVTHLFPMGASFDESAKLAVFATGLGTGGGVFAGDIQRPTSVASEASNAVSVNSTSVALTGADFAQVDGNGAVLIPIGANRMVAAGAGNIVTDNGAGFISDNGLGFAVRAGNDATLSVIIPGQGATTGAALISNAPSLFQTKKVGLFGPGGGIGNMLRPSIQGLVGLDGATLVGNDGASLGVFHANSTGVGFTPMAGPSLAAVRTADLYIGGRGALISNIGGALVPPGGIALVGPDGGTLISDNGLGIISDNGGGLISDNGLGVISDNGLGLVGNDGASLVGLDGGTLIGNDGSTLKTSGGGNFVNSGTGMLPSNSGR